MTKQPNILIVTSRYYKEIAAELEAGVTDVLSEAGATFEIFEVPGSFELPGAIALAAETEEHDGYIALGCVIRGETSHYDHICTEVARGIMELSLAGIPVAFGLLTCENEEQAIERASRKGLNKGREAAVAALRMVQLARHFRDLE